MIEKKLSLRELQLEELKILKDTVKIIEKYGLRYSLCGGTLLGAIRHKGFIPWDDDIDICMPRDDYDKFLQIIKNEKIHDDYEVLSNELNNSIYPFSKVINKQICIEAKSSVDKFLWIDIFPIDGLPNDDRLVTKQIKKIEFRKGIIYEKTTSFREIWKERRPVINKVLKVILKVVSYLIPINIISKQMNKIARQYNYDKSEDVGGYIWGYGSREKMAKKFVDPFIDVDFEGEKFKAFNGWNVYLTNLYGNYMKLPPEEKRIDHKIIAIKAQEK